MLSNRKVINKPFFFFIIFVGEHDFQHQDLNFASVARMMQLSRGAARSYVRNIIFFKLYCLGVFSVFIVSSVVLL